MDDGMEIDWGMMDPLLTALELRGRHSVNKDPRLLALIGCYSTSYWGWYELLNTVCALRASKELQRLHLCSMVMTAKIIIMIMIIITPFKCEVLYSLQSTFTSIITLTPPKSPEKEISFLQDEEIGLTKVKWLVYSHRTSKEQNTISKLTLPKKISRQHFFLWHGTYI